MTLSQEQAFLAGIGANPEDDGVRLIYADWLTERDQPGDTERAEFIRVQCEWSRVDRVLQGTHLETRGTTVLFTPQVDALIERYEWLVEREKKLLVPVWQRLENEWYLWQSPGIRDWWQYADFRRGFVECITLKAVDWCRYAERLRATQPIREVTLTTRLEADVKLRHHPPGADLWDLVLVGESEPFATVYRPDWRVADRLPGGLPRLRARVALLWPGIVFHGPDFPTAATVPPSLGPHRECGGCFPGRSESCRA